MKKQDFFEKVKKELIGKIDTPKGSKFVLRKITKANDSRLTALGIEGEGVAVSPNLYLDYFYDSYEKGEAFENIICEIAEAFQNALNDAPECPVGSFRYEDIKDKLMLYLMDEKENIKYLRNHLHLVWMQNLALCIGVDLGYGRIMLTEEIRKAEGWDMQDLIRDSVSSFYDKTEERLISMQDFVLSGQAPCELQNLFEKEKFETGENELYILTNASGKYGASVIVKEGVLKKLSDLLGNYLVIPSSVHELLILPDRGEKTPEELKNLVRDVNNTMDSDEILSYRVFRYDKDTAVFSEV